MKRCSRCKHEWYCSRECQIKGWKPHKDMCNVISKGNQEGAKKEPEAKEAKESKPLVREIEKVEEKVE